MPFPSKESISATIGFVPAYDTAAAAADYIAWLRAQGS